MFFSPSLILQTIERFLLVRSLLNGNWAPKDTADTSNQKGSNMSWLLTTRAKLWRFMFLPCFAHILSWSHIPGNGTKSHECFDWVVYFKRCTGGLEILKNPKISSYKFLSGKNNTFIYIVTVTIYYIYNIIYIYIIYIYRRSVHATPEECKFQFGSFCCPCGDLWRELN